MEEGPVDREVAVPAHDQPAEVAEPGEGRFTFCTGPVLSENSAASQFVVLFGFASPRISA